MLRSRLGDLQARRRFGAEAGFAAANVILSPGQGLPVNVGQIEVPQGAMSATYSLDVGDGKTADHLLVRQDIFASGGVRTQMAQLSRLVGGKGDFDIRLPDHAIPGQGGVQSRFDGLLGR